MSLFINASAEDTFNLTADYFRSKHIRILKSNAPSYLRAEFGSWTSLSLDNAKGEVEVEITRKNGGSVANVNFSFFKEYLMAFIIAISATLILSAVMWWRTSKDIPQINPADVGNFILKIDLVTFGLSATMFAVAIGLVRYSATVTKRKFTEEFKMFMQSLLSQKG